ncbi:MAG: MgtC/SapB family protein [Bacilli bacterium]|nr:MgtC/SapB family protein [Bacilli bacterium]
MFLLFYDPIYEKFFQFFNNSIWSVVIRIVTAVIMGAIIGCERSNKRHAAGLRTFILVTLAATVAMMLDYLTGLNTAGFYLPIMSGAVIIGVAIISSNTTLFTSRSQIKGLTTSVGLWACAILGLTLGAQLYMTTIILFVALLLSLSLFPVFESILKNRSNHFEVHLELKNASYLKDFVTTIRELGLKIDDIESNPAYINSGLSVYSISISITSKELKKYKTHKEIIEALKTLDYVYYIEEMN